MHISEGVLSGPALIGGAAITAVGVGIGLKSMDEDDIPKIAIVSSALFVASLVHIPIGPTSLHLILNGIGGILLGWQVFPAFLISLLLQGILFQFGGITTLGINTLNVALPAILAHYIFRLYGLSDNNFYQGFISFISGAFAILMTTIMVALSLISNNNSFREIANLAVISHIPVMVIEGTICTFVILFLEKVKPKILGGITYETESK